MGGHRFLHLHRQIRSPPDNPESPYMISQLMGDDDQKMLDHLILTTIPPLVLGAISITITDVLPRDARLPILTWELPLTTKTGLGIYRLV